MPSTLPTNPLWLALTLAVAFGAAFFPVVKEWIANRRHGPPAAPAPAAPVLQSQPQLDALLTTLVADLRLRTDAAEKLATDYARENGSLKERLAKAEERIETLSTQVQVLTDRLIRGQH